MDCIRGENTNLKTDIWIFMIPMIYNCLHSRHIQGITSISDQTKTLIFQTGIFYYCNPQVTSNKVSIGEDTILI